MVQMQNSENNKMSRMQVSCPGTARARQCPVTLHCLYRTELLSTPASSSAQQNRSNDLALLYITFAATVWLVKLNHQSAASSKGLRTPEKDWGISDSRKRQSVMEKKNACGDLMVKQQASGWILLSWLIITDEFSSLKVSSLSAK